MGKTEPVRWLTAEEREVWLNLSRLVGTLSGALDTQLQRDANLNYFEYIVLAMLSEQTSRSLRMTRLAEMTSSSLSRLSNVVKRLEQRGYLTRRPLPEDRRITLAVLTDEGMQTVVDAAPGHVEHVRGLVIDTMTREELLELREATDRILEQVDPHAQTRIRPSD